ncbi:MAG: hypothetical protein A2Y25_00185 [Candidatus Melainabacteria bacterium GWF2_37_15]|nr:MAG: hypothetical protein A2Y25_00185 [Candidatus Melainabacteria bacterium GWF2_37_15]
MKQHKVILARNSLIKAEEALKAGFDNLEINLNVAQNRAYYTVFYTVLALGYLDGFVTSSHHSLMGWFNKNYIHINKVFDVSLSKIYSTLIRHREFFDYDVSENPVKEDVLKDLNSAKIFLESLRPYILKRIEAE